MLRFSKPFYNILMAMFVHALFQGADDRRHNMVSAFVLNSWDHSYQYHSTATALNQLKMSKPFPRSDAIADHDRAQYCVEHFGSCTIAEMESLKNGFHAERMQSLLYGHENDSNILESCLIEGELDLQMTLLKEQNSITDVSVFPTDEIDDDVSPHLHDVNTDNDSTGNHNSPTIGIFHQPTPADIHVFEETVLEENLLEPIAICCAILGLALLPQFM